MIKGKYALVFVNKNLTANGMTHLYANTIKELVSIFLKVKVFACGNTENFYAGQVFAVATSEYKGLIANNGKYLTKTCLDCRSLNRNFIPIYKPKILNEMKVNSSFKIGDILKNRNCSHYKVIEATFDGKTLMERTSDMYRLIATDIVFYKVLYDNGLEELVIEWAYSKEVGWPK